MAGETETGGRGDTESGGRGDGELMQFEREELSDSESPGLPLSASPRPSDSPVSDIVKAAILSTGYENALKSESTDEADARLENLQELEDEGEVYESIEDIWPDYPSQEDFMFNEDEY